VLANLVLVGLLLVPLPYGALLKNGAALDATGCATADASEEAAGEASAV